MKCFKKKSLWKVGLAMLAVLFLSFQTTESVYAEEEGTETDQNTELSTAEGTLGTLTWSLSEGVLTITGAGEMVADKRAYPWKEYKDEIKKVIIGDEVTSIGIDAFINYELLEEVSIGKKVEVIGQSAFSCCLGLTSITIPTATKKLESSVFGGCLNLTNLTWSEGVESIGNGAFASTGLTSVVIPDSVTGMGTSVFSNCKELKSVTIGNGITELNPAVFLNCEKLETVILGDNVEIIGSAVFKSCTNLKSITFGKKIKEIYGAPFEDTGLVEIVLPDVDVLIGGGAFYKCNELKTITIGNGDVTIQGGAFGCEKLKTVTIGDGTVVIQAGAFSGCLKLENVTVGKNLTKINNSVFSYCAELKTFKTYSKDTEYPNGSIFESCPEVTLYGFPGSTTEAYAKEHNLAFQPIIIPTTPVQKKISNTVSGISLYWEKVSEAKSYTLYRAEGKNGEYEILAEGLTATNYLDKAVESGKTYYYKLTATDGTEVSEMSEAKGITFVGTPDITSRTNSAYGIRLGWNKVEGATGYAIYRKSYAGNDAWVRVATINGNDTFTWLDESVKTKNGEIYKYTVRALAGSKLNTLSGCRTAGRTMVRLTSRDLTQAVKKTATSIQCTWTTTVQATGYEVRFMAGDKVYKTFTVGNYKTGVKTFKDLPAGKKYKVQVRSYKKVEGVGGFYSAWSTAKYVEL